jgi:hypothetical protein
MPKLQFVDPISGNYIGIDKAKELLMNKIADQTSKIRIEGHGNIVVPEFEKRYKKRKELIEKYLAERVAENIAADSLSEIMDDLYFTITQGKQGVTEVSRTFKSQRAIGNQIGYFFEGGMFGEPKGSDPASDLRDIMTELKHVKTGSKYLTIGGITLESESLELMTENRSTTDAIMAAYKMYVKMQNLLLLRTHWESRVTGEEGSLKRKVKIDELTLFMELIFEKLWKILTGELRGQMADSVKLYVKDVEETLTRPEDGRGWVSGFKISYDLKFDMKKVNGAYKWADLYLRKIDYLKMIRTDDGLRAKFFGLVRHQFDMIHMKDALNL